MKTMELIQTKPVFSPRDTALCSVTEDSLPGDNRGPGASDAEYQASGCPGTNSVLEHQREPGSRVHMGRKSPLAQVLWVESVSTWTPGKAAGTPTATQLTKYSHVLPQAHMLCSSPRPRSTPRLPGAVSVCWGDEDNREDVRSERGKDDSPRARPLG